MKGGEKMNINLKNCETSAQAVTKICYNESTKNLDFKVRCENLEDLKKCVQIIKEYNDFNYKTINTALNEYASLKKYYDLFELAIAREGSPAMYISIFMFSISNKYKEANQIKEFSGKDFEVRMKALAGEIQADECDFYQDGCRFTCRLWWD